ncbi:MAG: hypothetical protein FJ135_11970 [Deltaproteobacteria bacterium]|nr:hypothetical protein [Deltaproteobacteria bacterium]
MIVVGWKAAEYGVKLDPIDRADFFEKDWETVTVVFDDGTSAECNLSESFWGGCPELRSAKIGRWMERNGLAPWPKDKPPELRLEPIGNRRFKLTR